MSEHSSRLNKKRWENDPGYAAKMVKIFSNHAKKLWSDPNWAAWKRKTHSETLRLKYANDSTLTERTKRCGRKNGKFAHEVTSEWILKNAAEYDYLSDFVRNKLFEKKSFSKISCATQFVKRRLKAAGFDGWDDYKNKYAYSNHKVVSVERTGKKVDVYDLTVDHFENFCLENQTIVSNSALDIYADESCSPGEEGQIVQVESPSPQIRAALEDLFYDTLNLQFEAWNWIRNLCKYGDQFLLVDHHPDYGVLAAFPLPINEIEREEGYDEENPLAYRYRWITQGNRVLENWQIIHFRLASNDNFLPYGSSVLEVARRVWRQLILMEDAVMVYRIVRSPERRVFKIDVGNIAPQDVPSFMEKARTQLKRNQIVDTNTGRVDLRYNPMSTDEDYFIPIRGEHSSEITTLPGGQYTGDIDDLKYIQNKLFAALKIPKSYLGYEEDMNAKSTLSQQDIRFARTIQRVQRVFVAELNKLAVIHLWSMGLRGNDLVDFELKMANPSTIAEMQKLELVRTKFEVSNMVPQTGMFDRQFVYDNIWGLPPEEIEAIEEGRRKDHLIDMEIQTMQPPMPMPGAQPPMAPMAPPPAPGAMPPPPPADGATPPPQPITAAKDPNKQTAAGNELTKPFGRKKSKEKSTMPDLKNYVFNTKKTALDPKRNRSELTRTVKAPFGESAEEDEESLEEKVFQRKRQFIRQVEKELQEVEAFKSPKKKEILKS